MSKSNNSEGGFIGKVGGTVVYQCNGQWIRRTIGVTTKLPTPAQLACREKMRMVTACLKPLKDILSLGFKVPKRAKGITAYNLACRYNLSYGVTGVYPELQMDYGNVLFAEGTMPLVLDCKAELNSMGVKFSWQQTDDSRLIHWNDQVVIIAYMPDEKDARYKICAAIRHQGEAVLKLPKYKTPVVLETYLFFVSADQKLVSNSAYTGQLIWNTNEI